MHAQEVSAIGKRSTWKGVGLFVFDSLLYLSFLAATVAASTLWLELLLSLATGFGISFLFLIGHDACHNSLTPHKRLNQIIGRLAFLPSLHPFSLWQLGHNDTHHRYTNLKTRDYVWRPLSLEEFSRTTWWSRAAYRFYRTPIGCLAYFLVEIWWKRMFFYELGVKDRRSIFVKDRSLVLGFIVAQAIFVYGLEFLLRGAVTWTRGLELGIVAIVLPFLIWSALASLLIYLHHTHPAVRWFANEEEWSYRKAQVECTVHFVFRKPINWFLHRIMEHTAHHVNPALPCYGLKEAQTALEKEHSGQVVVQPWSLGCFLNITRRCKLYDFDRKVWIDYEGRPTSGVVVCSEEVPVPVSMK